MSRWKVILATLVIFAAGAAVGVVVTLKLAAHRLPMAGNRAQVIRKIANELKLTEDQKPKLKALLDESEARTRLLWEAVEPYFHEEYRDLRDELRTLLTPEQRKVLDEKLRERYRRRGDDRRQSSDTNRPGKPPPRREAERPGEDHSRKLETPTVTPPETAPARPNP